MLCLPGEVIDMDEAERRAVQYEEAGLQHTYVMALRRAPCANTSSHEQCFDHHVTSPRQLGSARAVVPLRMPGGLLKGGCPNMGDRSADEVVDATAKGGTARFINHSCVPNCATEKWLVAGEVRVGIFARARIPAGAEVTYNYCLAWNGGKRIR